MPAGLSFHKAYTDRILVVIMGPEYLMDKSQKALRYLTGALGVFLLILFAIGVFDVGFQIYRLMVSGDFTEVTKIVGLIDTVLLLLIVLEVFRDLESYVKGKNLLPVIVEIGIIAVIRKIITTVASGTGKGLETIYSSLSSLLLLIGLFTGYFILQNYGQESVD